MARIPRGYSDWKQVTGYFDGDGNVNVRIMKFTLLFQLDWTDTDRAQVEQLRHFLSRERIRAPSILAYKPKLGRTSYNLRIASIEAVLKVAELMLPFSFKKSYELRLCIAYLRDQTSGKEAMMCLNRLVRAGIRSGVIRKAQHLSFTHSEGVRLAQLNSSRAAAVVNSVLNAVQREDVKRMYDSGQFGLTSLARKFGVSKNTILRIVRK
ncbi:MAG: hypothetical protein LYZ69_08725 [Nitrososphaerales archaeon]|nr:hypothetical protein [Nitrososphaerales archaeon]